MRGKLSQPIKASGSQAFWRALLQSLRIAQPGWNARVALACAGGLLVLSGCDRVDGEAASSANDGRSAESTTEADADTAFAWPDDPNHPLLQIDIEEAHGGGRIEIELMPELAPETVAHVIQLARDGFYDGTTFHRVIPDFMIQGGDPNSRDRDPSNDGKGGSDATIADEFGPAPFERGVVAMANKGRADSAGSQFFIMHADRRALDGRYTAIGRLGSGMDVVDAITQVKTDEVGRWGPKDRPIVNVVMTRVRPVDALDRMADSGSPPRATREHAPRSTRDETASAGEG